MKPTEEVILTHAQEANYNAERASWFMKGLTQMRLDASVWPTWSSLFSRSCKRLTISQWI